MTDREKLENTCNFENHVIFTSKMEKGFKKWTKIIRNESSIIKRGFFSKEIIDFNELESLVLLDKKTCISFSDKVFTIFKDVDFIRFKENNPQNVCKKKKHVISTYSGSKKRKQAILKKQEEQKAIQEAEQNDKALQDNMVKDGKYIVCFNCKKTITEPTKLRRLENQFYCVTCRDEIIKGRKEAKPEKNGIDEALQELNEPEEELILGGEGEY